MEQAALIIAMIALGMAVVIFIGQLLNDGVSKLLFKSRAAKISLICFAVYAVSFTAFLFLNNS